MCIRDSLSSANKVIVGDAARIPGRTKQIADSIRILLWTGAGGSRRLSDFVPMLVSTCEQKCFVTERLKVALQSVGDDRRIRVAEVWFRIDIVKRGSDIDPLHYRSPTTVNNTSSKIIRRLRLR